MAKTHIKSAFRIIPIHPADYSLLGMKWDHMYYFDRCLAMGLRSSCAIFEAFSTSLEWISIHLLKSVFCFAYPRRLSLYSSNQGSVQYQRTYCRGVGFYFERLAQYVADRWLTATVSESMVSFSRIPRSVLWFGKTFFAAFSTLYSAFYFISFFSETSFFYNHFLSSGHFVCTQIKGFPGSN